MIGSIIKDRRKFLKMSQQELAEGICTQALISKIERSDINPSADILYKVSEKLDVPLSFFYGEGTAVIYKDSIEELKDIIKKHLYLREYKIINELLYQHKKLIGELSEKKDIVFFQWIKSLLIFYFEKDAEKSLKSLKSLDLLETEYLLMIDILKSIGVIYYELNDFLEAEKIFFRIYNQMDDRIDGETTLKILLNYSLCLDQLEKQEEALRVVLMGIENCKSSNSMFLLGDFLHQKSLILSRFKDYGEAIKAAESAILIFDLQGREDFKILTKILLRKLVVKARK